ncbi:response regulator transcription factor [Thalassiella azotivora]
MITLLLADDQHLVREALAALLGLEPDLEVVAQVARGDDVVPAVHRHRPDVVLLDIEMPGRDGLRVAEDLRAVPHGPRVVVLTTFARPGYLHRALGAGAAGFLGKDARGGELAEAIRRVDGGEVVLDPALAEAARGVGASPLTPREVDVLRVAASGAPVAVVARRLFLAEGTVRNYLSGAMAKTGAATRAEAVRVAADNGWL